ncbi:MAG: SDR family oxidoreductase [Sedimentisphaerales bacterium]|nr:SDR family oxidoreductase [Sedimentisphaerales bacterium]
MNCPLHQLNGKRALITGGNRGLGLALAKGLAAHGADVVLVARTETQLQQAAAAIRQTAAVKVDTFAIDLDRSSELEAFFENVVDTAGPVDILVNCAGVNLRGPAETIDLDTWQQVLRLDLTAPFVLSQAFCRHRRRLDQPGRIINICSLLSAGGRPTTAAYAAAKTGLLGLTRALAVEWAPYRINVNAIGPGYFRTEMTEPLYQDPAIGRWVLDRTPLKRWGTPDELVGAALLLASEAGRFITGQIIWVDGGWLASL